MLLYTRFSVFFFACCNICEDMEKVHHFELLRGFFFCFVFLQFLEFLIANNTGKNFRVLNILRCKGGCEKLDHHKSYQIYTVYSSLNLMTTVFAFYYIIYCSCIYIVCVLILNELFAIKRCRFSLWF